MAEPNIITSMLSCSMRIMKGVISQGTKINGLFIIVGPLSETSAQILKPGNEARSECMTHNITLKSNSCFRIFSVAAVATTRLCSILQEADIGNSEHCNKNEISYTYLS